jgi:hypothetical protein
MEVINSSPLNRPAQKGLENYLLYYHSLFILALFYRDSIKHPFKDCLLIEKRVKVKIKNVESQYQIALYSLVLKHVLKCKKSLLINM